MLFDNVTPLLLNVVGAIGSLFIQRDSKTGNVKVSVIGAFTVCYTVSSVGCSFSDEPFSQCVKNVVAVFATNVGG